MKKIICFILTAALLIASTTAAFAKQGTTGGNSSQQGNKQQTTSQQKRLSEKKQSFKISGSSVIKYGRYKLPINPITKGMGATVAFDKETAVLTVTKGTTTIVIDFKNKKASVNGVEDTKSGIFTAKNDKKMTVLIKYIANALGVRVTVDGDKVDVTVPGLDLPVGVTVTPVGTTVVANTLNSTTLYFTASAKIIAGQATGGKAELYVGSKLVTTDTEILAADTSVNFTTADDTPTSAELQALVPNGGTVTVKLYNAENKFVTSAVANPTLNVDYVAPAITNVTSAVYSVSGSSISLNVTDAVAANDKLDVTKISVYDSYLNTSYQLTNAAGTGSTGVVTNSGLITITLGSADQLAFTGFGTQVVTLNIAAGSLLVDEAGNQSLPFTTTLVVPVTITN